MADDQIIDLDDLARGWGARDWAECSEAIRAGWGWCAKIGDGKYQKGLVWRGTNAWISVEDWRRGKRADIAEPSL